MWNGSGIPRCDSGNHEQPLSGEHDARAAAPSADGSRPGPGGESGLLAGHTLPIVFWYLVHHPSPNCGRLAVTPVPDHTERRRGIANKWSAFGVSWDGAEAGERKTVRL